MDWHNIYGSWFPDDDPKDFVDPKMYPLAPPRGWLCGFEWKVSTNIGCTATKLVQSFQEGYKFIY